MYDIFYIIGWQRWRMEEALRQIRKVKKYVFSLDGDSSI